MMACLCRDLPPETTTDYIQRVVWSTVIFAAAAYGLYDCRLLPILLTSRNINRYGS